MIFKSRGEEGVQCKVVSCKSSRIHMPEDPTPRSPVLFLAAKSFVAGDAECAFILVLGIIRVGAIHFVRQRL